jgi:hypothetical protein
MPYANEKMATPRHTWKSLRATIPLLVGVGDIVAPPAQRYYTPLGLNREGDMAKRFAYISFGLLCLVAAYQFGASQAVGSAAGSEILAMDHSGWFLDSSGQVWNVVTPALGSWTRWPTYDCPVPVSEVKYWGAHSLLTWADVAWAHDGFNWHEVGPFPGGPVTVDDESWGRMKERFR